MAESKGKKVADKGKKARLPRSTFYFEGKQYEATGETQKEADKNAALKEEKMKRGEIGISGNMSVKRWALEWLDTYKKPSITEKSYKNYKRHIEKVICAPKVGIGDMRLCDVTDIHLQKILNTRAGYSYSEAKHLRDTIRAIFKKARGTRKNGNPLIIYDPAEFLEMPATTKGTRRSLTDLERSHFLKVAANHPSGLMFKTMLYCGLRTGEVAALRWMDIDFPAKRINVSSAMESGKNTLKETKTAAGVRKVPIPDEILKDLLADNGDPFSHVFRQVTTGKPHTESSRNKAWLSIIRHMDISMGATVYRNQIKLSVVAPDLVPYCLRHTYCTDLQAKGVPINVAKYLMGHEEISVTAGIYTHMTDDVIADAANRINDKNNGKRIRYRLKRA
jgi:integrase